MKIFQELKSEGLSVSYPSVARIVNKLKLTGSIENRARSGRPRKLNEAARTFIEEQMRANDETTSCQIQKSNFIQPRIEFSNDLAKFRQTFFEILENGAKVRTKYRQYFV